MSYLGRGSNLTRKAQDKVSFLATAGQTVRTGLSYVPTHVDVTVNGITLTEITDYTATNGNSITFSVALALNDEVTIVSSKTFDVANHYTISAANALLAAKATNTAVALKAPLASPSFTGGIAVTGSTAHTAGDITNSISGSYKLFGANGTAGSNSYVTYCFEGDNDTGMNRTGNNNLQLVTAGAAAIKIDGAGIITKPLQPAFQAGCSSASQAANGPVIMAMLSVERFDNNADFGTDGYKFVAPVTGRYQFNWTCRVDGLATTSEHCSIDLFTSQRAYTYQTIHDMRSYDATPAFTSFTGAALVDMDANDVAYLRSFFNGTTGTVNGVSNWSGYLVC